MKAGKAKVNVVSFNPEGDGVTALYINGKYHSHGDYYHDKIDHWINGFIAGLTHAGVSVERMEDSIPGDKSEAIWQDANEPPKNWPDKKYYKHRNVE